MAEKEKYEVGYFLKLVDELRGKDRDSLAQYNVVSSRELRIKALNNHLGGHSFPETTEFSRIIDKNYIRDWIINDSFDKDKLILSKVLMEEKKTDSGLRGNLQEHSFGFESKIKYTYNPKTNEISFNQFKQPISITLLEAILKHLKESLL